MFISVPEFTLPNKVFKIISKNNYKLNRYVRDIPNTLRQAIRIAQSGTPGPVFVEFPIDTLYPIHLVQRELGVKEGATNLMQKIINMYLNNYLQSLFAGAFGKHDYTPLKTDIPLASQSQSWFFKIYKKRLGLMV